MKVSPTAAVLGSAQALSRYSLKLRVLSIHIVVLSIRCSMRWRESVVGGASRRQIERGGQGLALAIHHFPKQLLRVGAKCSAWLVTRRPFFMLHTRRWFSNPFGKPLQKARALRLCCLWCFRFSRPLNSLRGLCFVCTVVILLLPHSFCIAVELDAGSTIFLIQFARCYITWFLKALPYILRRIVTMFGL